MQTLFLDTETTGLSGSKDRIVEIAIVDEDGQVVFESLIHPGVPIPYQASRVHGITDAMVRSAPRFEAVWPYVESLVRGHRVVIYNARFDTKFFPDGLACAAEVHCAMLAFSARIADGKQLGGRRSRWHKLSVAAAHAGHQWSGAAHRARGDAEACRSVWLWLEGRAPVAPVRPRPALPVPRPVKAAVPSVLPESVNRPTPDFRTVHPSDGPTVPWGWITVGGVVLFLLLR